MPFRVGPTELIIVLAIVMIIFGVGRLPQVGGALGKAIKEFRSSVSGIGGEETVSSGRGVDDREDPA